MATTTPPSESISADKLQDYHDWRAMGPGGLPYDWSGYQACIDSESIAWEDTVSTDIYQDFERRARGWSEATPAQRSVASKSFFHTPLPQRNGPRARAKRYVIPQREKNATDPQDYEIKRAYDTMFTNLGASNAETTEWKTSVLEKHGRALFLLPTISLNPLASPTKGEICHIHSSDLSGHVTLSFADAQEVVAKGWGERHRLSGTDWIHLGYTMVYVPRSVDETNVFRSIFQAGIDFMKCQQP